MGSWCSGVENERECEEGKDQDSRDVKRLQKMGRRLSFCGFRSVGKTLFMKKWELVLWEEETGQY